MVHDLIRDVEALGVDRDFDHSFDRRLHVAFPYGRDDGKPIPPYTRDISAAVALIRRVLGAEVCFVINSTEDTVACTIWRAGPEQRLYAGFQIVGRGPFSEAQATIGAMLRCLP